MPKKRTKYGKKVEDVEYISESNNFPRCFVCDDRIRGKGVQLVMGRTPYSNTGLPAKIGQLIGEDFMVVVCVSDLVCARCTALISQLDKLENDMHYIKKTLTGYLASKYNLYREGANNKSGSSEEAMIGNSQNEPSSKKARLSSEPTPNPASILLATRNKVKQYGCENCSFTTTDPDALLPHYSICARLVHRCSVCPARFESSSSLAQHKRESHATKWTCHACSLNFVSEQDYSNHKRTHLKKADNKCGVGNFTSSDKSVMDDHIQNHAIQMHQCPVCRISFEAESNLESHMECHYALFKCTNCQATFQQKTNLEEHQRLVCKVSSSVADDCRTVTSDGIQGDHGLSDDLSLENLIKVDGSDPSTDSIEFYSCQSCALTFLNKMLFTEHMKMHLDQPEKHTLDKGEISDAHAEILKSATASISGVCHIDDDLEDLFEKLHAETSNPSALIPSSDVNKTSPNGSNNASIQGGSSSAVVDGEILSQDAVTTTNGMIRQVDIDVLQNSSSSSQGIPVSDAVDTDSAHQISLINTSAENSQDVSSTMSSHLKVEGDSMDSNNGSSGNMVVIDASDHADSNALSVNVVGISPDEQGDESASLEMLALNCTEQNHSRGAVVNMAVMDHGQTGDTNSIGNVHEDGNQAIVSMAVMDPSQQQTLIYISSGDGLTDGDQQEMVLHNATIDPSSGNIQLLQYVIDDTGTPPDGGGDSHMSVIESEGNFQEQNHEQNFCKVKPEPGLAENNPGVVCGVGDNEYMCAQCGFQTSILTVLKRHLKAHQNNQVHQCSICNRVFSSTQRLLSHLDSHTDNDGPVKCPFCFIELENCFLLHGHLQDQHPEEKQCFRCRFCDRKFSSKRACSSHEETHTDIFVFTCLNCGKKFPSEEELDDHTNKYHRTNSKCRYCDKVIENPKALQSHEQRHMQESNHHECTVCKRVFKTKTGLRHHGAVHTGEFKYCCDFCGRGFMSRMMLEEHRSRHTKEERYICDVCGRKFTFQSTYWIHRKWHDNPYPYKCNFCGRMFRHTSLLAVHKRKHTGERPYKCPHCPMSFPVGGTLKRHLILHTGVYPYNCESCKRGFTTKHKYASHLAKVHGDFDLMNIKPQVKDFKMVVHEPIKEGTLDTAESWELMNDLALGHVDDSNVDETGTEIAGDDLMPSDNVIPTRVVEIVMDDSYQAVATVTLAEVSEGGDASIIPDMWYQ